MGPRGCASLWQDGATANEQTPFENVVYEHVEDLGLESFFVSKAVSRWLLAGREGALRDHAAMISYA